MEGESSGGGEGGGMFKFTGVRYLIRRDERAIGNIAVAAPPPPSSWAVSPAMEPRLRSFKHRRKGRAMTQRS